jgi:hypothetical protein
VIGWCRKEKEEKEKGDWRRKGRMKDEEEGEQRNYHRMVEWLENKKES